MAPIGTRHLWALTVQKTGQRVDIAKAQIPSEQFNGTFAPKVYVCIRKAFMLGIVHTNMFRTKLFLYCPIAKSSTSFH